MRGSRILASMQGEVVYARVGIVENIIATLDDGEIPYIMGTPSNEDVVVYQRVNNIGIISVDGVMHKKGFYANCANIISYETIIDAIDIALKDEMTDKILLRVETRGGVVSGLPALADAVEEAKKTKEVILFAENIIASAGLYAFFGASKRYATKETEIGSIGAVVVFTNQETNTTTVVSKNAKNKNCDLDGDCLDRIQQKIDTHEGFFLAQLEKTTGKDKETIVKDFNNGDTIFAEEALKKGYLDGVTTFNQLMLQLVSQEADPIAISDNSNQITGEHNMADEVQFTEDGFKALKLAYGTSQARLEEATVSLEEMQNKVEAIQAELKNTKSIALQAVKMGVESEGALAEALEAKTPKKATKILTKALESDAIPSFEAGQNEEIAYLKSIGVGA